MPPPVVMTHSDISDSDDLLRVANLLADAARPETLAHFRSSDLAADNKLSGGFDPVTEADRAAERAMRKVLEAERPEDSILGEEYGTKQGSSGLTWVLDPIDGTRGYICGTPTWGVLVAVGPEDGPKLGVIDQPYIRERFVGGFGQAYVEGPSGRSALRVSTCRDLAQAKILTTFPEVGTEAEGKAFHSVSAQGLLTRYGMDCYGYALLATGQVDLVIEAGLQSYDIQAPIAVIEAAGGVVTDWSGNPAHNGGRALAAATPELHGQAMEQLASFI